MCVARNINGNKLMSGTADPPIAFIYRRNTGLSHASHAASEVVLWNMSIMMMMLNNLTIWPEFNGNISLGTGTCRLRSRQ